MNTNDEGFEKLIDSRIGDDESLQMLSNDKGVALLAFIGSYVPRRYNPSTSRRASISTIDEFGMEEALKSIRDASGGKKIRGIFPCQLTRRRG